MTTDQLYDFYKDKNFLKASLVKHVEDIIKPILSSGLNIIEEDLLICYVGDNRWEILEKCQNKDL